MTKQNPKARQRWIEQNHLFTTAAAERQGISRMALSRLARQGKLQRLAHGLYASPNAEQTFDFQLIVAAHVVPAGVLTLLSALQFHGLTTETPHRIWIAVPQKSAVKKQTVLPLKIVYYSGPAYKEGREKHLISGFPVFVYSPAKTVADCFKFRNKIGLDIAIQALKESLQKKLCSVDELWYSASICRVANVMQPYLESLQ